MDRLTDKATAEHAKKGAMIYPSEVVNQYIRLAEYEDLGTVAELAALKAELERLNISDASKEESSINYYNETRELKAENERLKAGIEIALAVLNDNRKDIEFAFKKYTKEGNDKLVLTYSSEAIGIDKGISVIWFFIKGEVKPRSEAKSSIPTTPYSNENQEKGEI